MTINKEEEIDEGIVLASHPYKENDALITVYMKNYGKMTMIARGVKKLKSKNASAVMTITLSELTFFARKGLSTLKKATPIQFYRHIKENLLLEAYATYFIEFVLKNEEDNEPNGEIYNQLKLALDYLEQGYHYKLVYLLFNAFILKVCGTSLQVDGCVYCLHRDKIAGISYGGGGFVCVNCIGEYDTRLEKDVLKAFRHINKCDLRDIDRLDIDDNILDQLIFIMDCYVDEYTGLIMKSRQFIQQLSKL